MNRIALLLAMVVLIAGCEDGRAAPEPVVKIIGEKLASVEQVFDMNELERRPTTVYYLIAEDGSRVTVTLKEYSHAKVGDEFASTHWED